MKTGQFRRPAILFAVVLVLVVAGVALTPASVAQQLGQALGLDPDAQPQGTVPPAVAPAGIQPDQDGYSGPLPAAPAPAKDALDQRVAPPVAAFDLTGQPDALSGPAAPGAWSGFYYFFAAGSSLHSADYLMRSDYQPGACVAAVDSGAQFFTLNLDLPQGSRIDYLRLFYYDTNASDGQAQLRKYDGAGNLVDVSIVSSTGAAGYGTILSAYAGSIVDNMNGSYVLNWWPIATGSTMQLCGMRVAYRMPQ